MASTMSLSPALPRFINRLLSVGADSADSPDLRERKRLFVGALWGGIFVNSFFALPFFAFGTPLAASLSAFAVFGLSCLLINLRLRPALFSAWVHLGCLFVILYPLSFALLFGGLNGGFLWGFLAPVCALIMLGQRAGRFWVGAFCLSVIVAGVSPNWIPILHVMLIPPSAIMGVTFIVFGLFIFLVDRKSVV